MNIGENIKKYRIKRGLSQAELAELANISRVAIGNYERGERTPNTEIASKIAKALDISLMLLVQPDEINTHGITLTPNYSLMEEEAFPTDLVKHYEKIIDHERKIHAEYIASLILTLKKDVKVLQQRIYENEEYLKILISHTNYTLDNFLKIIEDEENKAQEYLNPTINK